MPGLLNGGHGPGSSRKRSRQNALDEDSEEDIIDVQQASSSFRRQDQSHRKRVRVSDIVTEAGPSKYRRSSDASDSSDDDVEVQDSRMAVDSDDEPDVPPQSQYEEMRDGDFEHLQHEHEDDTRATQRLRSRADVVGDNRVADNGILESIECINFMCHTRLSCQLGPLLNFIVGENGSGKSAILTAITLCLGGKASSTNRGGSLKTFVKEGADQSILRVRIKNQGIDAYQHDLYGDSITVERTFTKSGSSGFKLKSETGRTISKKRDDVNEIVEYYCLQVDNPLNVLSQDNARQFLNASSASLKYKYFIQGVQLEQLDKDYALIKEFVDATEGKLPAQEDRVRESEVALKEAQRLKQAIEQNEDLRRRGKLYSHQLAWIQVEEQENKLQECQKELEDARHKMAELDEQVQDESDKLSTMDEKIKQEQDRLQPLQVEDAEIVDRVKESEDKLDDLKRDHQELLTNQRDVRSHITSQGNSIKDLETKIGEEEQRLEDRNGTVVKETQDRLEDAKREVDEFRQTVADTTARLPQLLRDKEVANNALTSASKEVEAKRRDIASVQSKISDLRQGSGSQYDGYEARVPQLLKRIASDQGFTEKPIGPLGSLIQITKPIWSSIIEKSLGGSLNAFLVTSKGDHQRLQAMMKDLGIQRCPIMISNTAHLDTSGREPAEQFDTILRVLKFDNERVRSQLIIGNRIEQIILVQDRKEAQKIMHRGAAPQNVHACLCQHDGKRGHGLRLTNQGGSISTSPVYPWEGKPRMKANADDQISVHQEMLHQHEADLRRWEAEKRQHAQKQQQCETLLKSNKKQVEQLKTKQRVAEAAVSTIEAELDQFDGADGRLKNLQDELADHLKSKEHYGTQYGEMEVQMTELKSTIADLNKVIHGHKMEKADSEAKLKKVDEKIKRLEELRKITLGKKNVAIRDRDIQKIAIDDDLKTVERRKARVETFVIQASEICPTRVAIPEGETGSSLEKKFEAVQRQLTTRSAKLGMSDVEVNNKVFDTKTTFDNSKKALEVSKEQIMGMKQGLMSRLEKWRIFQRYISANSRSNFQYLLSERGFRGSLKLDHQNKRLQVTVEPDETKERSAARNTKTLSGGEKSFTSICLLLAIWEAMGSPLRCLDEFDVFMDNVNRAISTNMLIGAARRSVGRQYILITPNSIEGHAVKDKDVKIIRLTDPRQRTLV